MTSSYQPDSSKLLWVIMSGLTLVVVLFFAVQWFWAHKDQPSIDITPTSVAAPGTAPATAETVSTAKTTTQAANEAVATPIQLVEESIIKDALPANDSLAKEEIAKLDDIQQQLNDQQQSLKQQHSDVDALVQLKEEQVKLLEAQLAAQQ